MSNHTFTLEEEKTRGWWLKAAVCHFLLFPFILIVVTGIVSMDSQIPPFIFYSQIGGFLVSSLWFWLSWAKSYQKAGIHLLLFFLIITPIGLLRGIPEMITSPLFPRVLKVSTLSTLPVTAWWYILSLKMRKINKSKQPLPQTEQST